MDFPEGMGPLGSRSQACQGVGGGRGCLYFSSHSQGPLLGPRCPERGPLCPTLWEAPAGARRCRQAGVNGTLLLSACPGPTPLAESSQVTFEGAAAALGGSPKASGLLLAFSCPLARPAWAWPEKGLTSAWPRKVAQPVNLCLRVQNRRMQTAAHTRISQDHRGSRRVTRGRDALSALRLSIPRVPSTHKDAQPPSRLPWQDCLPAGLSEVGGWTPLSDHPSLWGDV